MKNYSELIDKICDGELTAEELEVIDQLLENDQDFIDQLEAHSDIIDHLHYEGKKEQLEEYHREYIKERTGSGLVPRKTWLVAASLLLFLSAATFAYFNFIIPREKLPVVSEDPVNNQRELAENIDLIIQQYQLSGVHDLQLTTEAGVRLGFPAGSIKDAKGNLYLDEYQLELMEVTDAQQISNIISLKKNKQKRPPDLLIYLGLQNSNLSFNRLNPPGLLDDYRVQKAAFDTTGITVMSLSNLDLPVIQLNKVMQDYQRYQESKVLLDSVALHYSLDGKEYHPKNGNGLVLDKSFINKVKRFVQSYEASKHFVAKVNQAQYCWSLYQKQHQLTINQSKKSIVINHYLPQQGWYAVWKA